MRLGFVGLGRMGASMAHRLLDGGHEVVVWNRSEDPALRNHFGGQAVTPAD